MKKIVTLLVLVVVFNSCTEQTKIAYVDVEELMKEYKGTKEAEATMKVKSESLQKELDSLIGAWQNKAKIYQESSKGLSAKVRSEKEQALMQEQQQINQRQQAVQQQVQAEGQKSLEALSKEINDFVKNYAKEKGYNFVLGTTSSNGTVMYGEEKADITDDVLVQLNKTFKTKE
ncbi:MAG TPA: hypothetical protein DDZ39_11410 [Flavobacteriaceae bacterium]|jgi:outer membrane protein|nr:hypothetical protein [Flavobacteriaceae bacterium]HBS12397.1 hypothetical protein [Flavobacteriaceae bacterium]